LQALADRNRYGPGSTGWKSPHRRN
jgi:hypothetical protein